MDSVIGSDTDRCLMAPQLVQQIRGLTTMPRLLLLALFAIFTLCIRVNIFVDPNGYQCFYEHFQHNTKYRFFLSPQNITNYVFELQSINDTAPKVLWRHEANSTVDQLVNLHKFASEAGIHGFCVQNNEEHTSTFQLKLQSGIELMELDALPNANDTSLLDAEIKLLQAEFKSVVDSLTSIQASKGVTQEVFEMMSNKTFAFGVIGMGVVFLINAVFYKVIKKTLHDRKRI